MNTPTDADLYQSIGRAIIATQMFETMFVLSARLAMKQKDAQILEGIVPISISHAVKQPIKSLLKELSSNASIDPRLESRIEALIESRHEIVHRQFLSGGWPSLKSDEARVALRERCVMVNTESVALALELIGMLLSWSARFPKLRKEVEKNCDRMADVVNVLRGRTT